MMAAVLKNGVAVYISMRGHNHKDTKFEERWPAEMSDCKNVPGDLESMGFEMLTNEDNNKFFMNIKCNDVNGIVKKAAEKCQQKPADVLMVIVSTHGQEVPDKNTEKLYLHQIALHDDWMNTKDLVNKFSESVSDIPIIFFIQACSARDTSEEMEKGDGDKEKDENSGQNEGSSMVDRGEDKGITIHLTDEEPNQDLSGYRPSSTSSGSGGAVIPACVRNSIVVFSSASGRYSFGKAQADNTEEQGGWYLKNFHKEFQEMEDGPFSLLDLLTRVNQKMSREEAAGYHFACKAVASMTHKLTKEILLEKKTKK